MRREARNHSSARLVLRNGRRFPAEFKLRRGKPYDADIHTAPCTKSSTGLRR